MLISLQKERKKERKKKLDTTDCHLSQRMYLLVHHGLPLQNEYCNFTKYQCSFISVISLVNGFTDIKRTAKWEKYMYMEWSREHPRAPNFKLNRTLRDRLLLKI